MAQQSVRMKPFPGSHEGRERARWYMIGLLAMLLPFFAALAGWMPMGVAGAVAIGAVLFLVTGVKGVRKQLRAGAESWDSSKALDHHAHAALSQLLEGDTAAAYQNLERLPHGGPRMIGAGLTGEATRSIAARIAPTRFIGQEIAHSTCLAVPSTDPNPAKHQAIVKALRVLEAIDGDPHVESDKVWRDFHEVQDQFPDLYRLVIAATAHRSDVAHHELQNVLAAPSTSQSERMVKSIAGVAQGRSEVFREEPSPDTNAIVQPQQTLPAREARQTEDRVSALTASVVCLMVVLAFIGSFTDSVALIVAAAAVNVVTAVAFIGYRLRLRRRKIAQSADRQALEE